MKIKAFLKLVEIQTKVASVIPYLTTLLYALYSTKQLNGINAMIMLDVDCFKSINDTFGHSVGDMILQSISKIACANMRSIDAVIRWGGDEFVLVFQGITKRILEEKLENIRKAVENISVDEQPQLKTSVSMGCVYANHATAFFEEADKALYEAKAKRNCYVVKYINVANTRDL